MSAYLQESDPIDKTISKQQRKLDQMTITIHQLHERLAKLQSSKRNKESEIARLKGLLQQHDICTKCGVTTVGGTHSCNDTTINH